MRILLDLQACQSKGSRHRGIGRYSMSLAIAMLKNGNGHEFWVALSDRFPETLEPIRQALSGLIPPERIKVFCIPADVSEHDASHAWRCRAAEQIREDFLARLQPDIVHVSSLFEGLTDDAVTSVGRLQGNHLTAVTAYDLIPLLRKDIYLTDPSVRQWYYRKLQMLKNADILLAISESARQEAKFALQLTDARAVNISSAVDDAFQPTELTSEIRSALLKRFNLHRPFVMYTGGIDHRKNIEGLLEGYAKLPTAVRTQHQLAVVCSIRDEDRARLNAVASGFGLQKNEVIFTGFVSDEDLLALYNASKLFVFPSLHEGFGLPALEAMSCGIAVIGSNTSSIPEVIGREDALFDPTRPQDISAKMQQALTDDDFRAALESHGVQQAKLFSWDASARRALDAFERLTAQHSALLSQPTSSRDSPKPKPRLAYISPLPPDQSGIADYSAELLPELARFYDIDVVSPQAEVTDPWILANFPLRTVDWFEANAHRFERTVYHFGNSAFHSHMFGLLKRHPGVVVLHDFFMSGILDHLDHSGGEFAGVFRRALYESHGYAALLEEAASGREAALWKYPLNKQVLDDATGVIIHSNFSRKLADSWYGPEMSPAWKYIPHLRALPAASDREAIRRNLGMAQNDFLICSFGMLGPTKQNARLLKAVLDCPAVEGKTLHLVFVGQNHPGDYGQELIETMTRSGWGDRLKITGFASQSLYRDYLVAADAAVQLRAKSRGETSGTILDCLAYGIPTIINAHGSAADIPADVSIKLDDDFEHHDLVDAIVRLRDDAAFRSAVAERAVTFIRSVHHPEAIGQQYRDAIETLVLEQSKRRGNLVLALANLPGCTEPTENDLIDVARSVSKNMSFTGNACIYIDISRNSAEEGHKEVVGLLKTLLDETSTSIRVEAIRTDGASVWLARQLTSQLLGLDFDMADEEVDLHPRDLVVLTGKSSVEAAAAYEGARVMRLDWLPAGGNSDPISSTISNNDASVAKTPQIYAATLNDAAQRVRDLARGDIYPNRTPTAA